MTVRSILKIIDNTGCMINGYVPCTLEELEQNNRLFKDILSEVPDSPVLSILSDDQIPEIFTR